LERLEQIFKKKKFEIVIPEIKSVIPEATAKINGEESKVGGEPCKPPLDVGKKQASAGTIGGAQTGNNEETANSSTKGTNGEASTNSAKMSPVKTVDASAAAPPI
jgi:hypothetical protein